MISKTNNLAALMLSKNHPHPKCLLPPGNIAFVLWSESGHLEMNLSAGGPSLGWVGWYRETPAPREPEVHWPYNNCSMHMYKNGHVKASTNPEQKKKQ